MGIGAVLEQGKDGKMHPIAFVSRSLTKEEKNYSTTHKELLAVIWALKQFRPYIYKHKTVVHTDHQPLKHIVNMKNEDATADGRLARWLMTYSIYNPQMEYKPGKRNAPADALSRLMPDPETTQIKVNNVEIDTFNTYHAAIYENVIEHPHAAFIQSQMNDPYIAPMLLYLTTGQLPDSKIYRDNVVV